MAGRFSVEAVFKAVDRVTLPVSRMQNRVGKMTRTMERGFRRTTKAVNKMVGGIGRAGKAALKFGALGLGALTAAVTLLVREFSKVENAQAAFTPLLGGVEKAKQLVDELNKTAASTPFQFENLAAQASQLLPVMNGDIQNTIKTIRMLGDTAGGNAQKLDSITRGFTKAMLKGKVDMESLNMIAEAGVPIFNDLASVMGVEVNAAFFKMISAGKVTTTALTAAFEKMTTKGGIFFNGMQIASQTTTGMWSTMMDNISLTAATLGGILAPVVKDLILGATDAAKRVREWVTANRELISDRFIQFVEMAKSAIVRLIDTIRTLGRENNIFERMGEVLSKVTDGLIFLAENGKTIVKVTAWVGGLVLALNALAAIMTIVNIVMTANPIGLLIVGIAALAVGIAALVRWFGKLIEKAGGFGAIASSIGGFFGIGGEDEEDGRPTGDSSRRRRRGPQVVSPSDRIARSVEEQRTTSTAEVTIKDETGRAEVTRGALAGGVALQPTGAF
jgi:tape measure domain-containing protein